MVYINSRISYYTLLCFVLIFGVLTNYTTVQAGGKYKWPKPSRYLKARNLPLFGKTLVFMGQDSDTVEIYRQAAQNLVQQAPEPGGITLYTNLVGAPNWGLFQPVNYGAGAMDFERTLNEFGGALAVGLFLSGDGNNALRAIGKDPSTDPVVVERYELWVEELVRYLKSTRRHVFLRIGYEFDNPFFGYQPEAYIAAFRAIKLKINELRAYNIATVWQASGYPAAEPLFFTPDPLPLIYDPTDPQHWQRWYPGDKYVDWTAISFFYGKSYDQHQWHPSCERSKVISSPEAIRDTLLDFARERGKPVMIPEASPAGYDLENLSASCISGFTPPEERVQFATAEDLWNNWFKDFFDYVEHNRDIIRAVAYINANWEEQFQFSCSAGLSGDPQCPSGWWGDNRVEANEYILKRFINELKKPIYTQKQPRYIRNFEAPDLSPTRRIYEAEYADSDFGWFDGPPFGQFHGALSLPQPAAGSTAPSAASNGRYVLLLNFLGWEAPNLIFENVTWGRTVSVRYSAISPNPDDTGGTFSVWVNNQQIGTHNFSLTGADTAFTDVSFDTSFIPWGSDIQVQLDSVSGVSLYIDSISVEW